MQSQVDIETAEVLARHAAVRAVTAELDSSTLSRLGQPSQKSPQEKTAFADLRRELKSERQLLQQAMNSSTVSEDASTCFAFMRRDKGEPLQPRLQPRFLERIASRLDGFAASLEECTNDGYQAASSSDSRSIADKTGAGGNGALHDSSATASDGVQAELWNRLRSATAAREMLEERVQVLERQRGLVLEARAEAWEWKGKHSDLAHRMAQLEAELQQGSGRGESEALAKELQQKLTEAQLRVVSAEEERATALEYAKQTEQALERIRTALTAASSELQEQVRDAERRASKASVDQEDMARSLQELRQERDALQAELQNTVQRLDAEKRDLEVRLAQVETMVLERTPEGSPTVRESPDGDATKLRGELKDAELRAAEANKALAATMEEYDSFRKQISKKALALTDELQDVRQKLKHCEGVAATTQASGNNEMQEMELHRVQEENGELRLEIQAAISKLNEQVKLSEAERNSVQRNNASSDEALQRMHLENETIRQEVIAAQAKLEAQRRAYDEDRAVWWNELASLRKQESSDALSATIPAAQLASPARQLSAAGHVLKRQQSSPAKPMADGTSAPLLQSVASQSTLPVQVLQSPHVAPPQQQVTQVQPGPPSACAHFPGQRTGQIGIPLHWPQTQVMATAESPAALPQVHPNATTPTPVQCRNSACGSPAYPPSLQAHRMSPISHPQRGGTFSPTMPHVMLASHGSTAAHGIGRVSQMGSPVTVPGPAS
mmetsp:Transcript_60146/g.143357  ORF Transcript_60146/g.143357 Transcript_60146/m.143357 type:complete len:729 (-) Transcript_60146:92-2278(-)